MAHGSPPPVAPAGRALRSPREGWRTAILGVAVALLGLVVGFRLGTVRPRPEPWPSYAAVFERVAPSVVNVSLEGPVTRVGSGFAISPEEIVTARHLVVDAEQVLVRDISGRTLPAAVVGTDARTDLALLRVPGAGLQPVGVEDPVAHRVGDTVIAIGNPYGLSHSLAVGVIGGRGRRLLGANEEGVAYLQLSIPLNPGNSGGPVFDGDGRLVGVLSGTHAQGQAIGFAVPASALTESLPALRAGQRVSRAFLGARAEVEDGALVVTSVIPSSPADRAGMRTGDVLVAFGDDPVATPRDLARALDRYDGGAEVPVSLRRDGAAQAVQVLLADWAEQPVVIGGMTLRPAPGAGARWWRALRSRAEKAGIAVGDVVRSVDGVPVRAPADIRDALANGNPAQLDVVGGVPVAVQLGSPGRRKGIGWVEADRARRQIGPDRRQIGPDLNSSCCGSGSVPGLRAAGARAAFVPDESTPGSRSGPT
ncbi:MAG: trypsin-like peptidase domain-containing protein [Myxococcota bacterium]